MLLCPPKKLPIYIPILAVNTALHVRPAAAYAKTFTPCPTKEGCFCLPTLVYNYVGEETSSPALYQTFLTAKAQTLIYSK